MIKEGQGRRKEKRRRIFSNFKCIKNLYRKVDYLTKGTIYTFVIIGPWVQVLDCFLILAQSIERDL